MNTSFHDELIWPAILDALIRATMTHAGFLSATKYVIFVIPSKYRASIADTDTDTDTCHLKKHTFKWPPTLKKKNNNN